MLNIRLEGKIGYNGNGLKIINDDTNEEIMTNKIDLNPFCNSIDKVVIENNKPKIGIDNKVVFEKIPINIINTL